MPNGVIFPVIEWVTSFLRVKSHQMAKFVQSAHLLTEFGDCFFYLLVEEHERVKCAYTEVISLKFDIVTFRKYSYELKYMDIL